MCDRRCVDCPFSAYIENDYHLKCTLQGVKGLVALDDYNPNCPLEDDCKFEELPDDFNDYLVSDYINYDDVDWIKDEELKEREKKCITIRML